MKGIALNGIWLVMGVAVLAMVFGSKALADDDTQDRMIGPSIEGKKESIEKSSPERRENLSVPEITKEFERPMSVPDPRSERVMPDRRPLCGPWKNAINHVYCAPGYDFF